MCPKLICNISTGCIFFIELIIEKLHQSCESILSFVIFSRRFSEEKCPTLTVASFSFFFVRLQSHSDWATFTIETTTIRPSPVSGN